MANLFISGCEQCYYDGIKSLQFGDHRLAAAQFTNAMNSDKYRMSALYMRSVVYVKLNDLKSAADDLNTMVSQFPEQIEGRHLEVINRAAHLYLNLRDYPKTMSLTMKGLFATLHKKESIPFLILSAKIYLSLNRPDLARGEYQKILAIDPSDKTAKRMVEILPAMAQTEEIRPPILPVEKEPSEDPSGPCKVQ